MSIVGIACAIIGAAIMSVDCSHLRATLEEEDAVPSDDPNIKRQDTTVSE